MKEKQIITVLPMEMRQIIKNKHLDYRKLQEMKLRVGKPMILVYDGKEMFLTRNGMVAGKAWEVGNSDLKNETLYLTERQLRETMDYISNYSLYAFEEEMKQGFITIEGGHRVGLTGQVILEHGKVKNIKYISSINIRVSHEVIGCAEPVFFCYTKTKNEGTFQNTMIISPPGCGKTTLLRDMIRQLSDGNAFMKGMTVGVVDERSEIGGCYRGIPQNQIGIRTDILDCCPKVQGMMMLIRSMNPKVIAVDEIGTEEDMHAIEYALHCGCKMLVTVHGDSLEDVKSKPTLRKLIDEGIFERFVVLGNRKSVGEIVGIYDREGNRV